MTDVPAGQSQGADDSGPSFDRPPVNEVALAVYFQPGLPLRTVDLGGLWDRWRSQFPEAVDQPTLPPVSPETFPRPSLSSFIQFGPPPGARTWFINATGDQLVQIQADRLVLNWRKLDVDAPYPRYGALRPVFLGVTRQLFEFVSSRGHPVPAIAQAEVTYINAIPMASLPPKSTAADVLAPWTGRFSDGFLPVPESTSVSSTYVIPNEAGQPIGRLYTELSPVVATPAMNAAPEAAALLQLYARGRPAAPDLDAAFAFLDIAHHWVVNSFRSLTRPSMHRQWGLSGS